ncbi:MULTISPECIES: mobilization protein [unclassified Pseudomonas]|uniref:mobilization protein n=1 Tax=unclassified Pseudomonas TaxID=196821 RepID=UPI002AB3912C|nr:MULTISPECIES: mobilization protein [unclassified Pseudomonas]MDY7563442.1 mobilization protein [Pseudomonas sp. AB6]MEA9980015.1 mobilization protein [Pseudomonas sp. RTS4]MEA9996512.1 mobilization protein [Pseudomonas sp. AA4]MEB0198182.1 mobilization protein [Pseudomonas sp. 5S4]MEB0213385.1 mobilization protein [Pseudomonas sp. AB6]
MAKTQTFTQNQLESAKHAMAQLPDLRKNKITTSELLESLRDQIVVLANSKGYSPADIKSALGTINVVVSLRAITELLSNQKKPRTLRKAANNA